MQIYKVKRKDFWVVLLTHVCIVVELHEVCMDVNILKLWRNCELSKKIMVVVWVVLSDCIILEIYFSYRAIVVENVKIFDYTNLKTAV